MRRRLAEGAGVYGALVAEAALQLATQLSQDGPELSTLAVVPVVGFGGQSLRVIERTIDLLLADADVRSAVGRRCVVAVVNRPIGRAPDGTAERLLRAREALVDGGGDDVQIAVCDVALPRRPRMGELRQLGVDAVELSCGSLAPEAVVVVADDDLVLLPAGTLAGLEGAARDGAALAVGSVLFDDPALPMWRIPDLFVADIVRALLADRLVAALGHPGPAAPLDQSVYESLVLSGHLGVRRDALDAIGGFRDLNEITGLMRDVLATRGRVVAQPAAVDPGPAANGGNPLERLRRDAVRVSSRRALLAWRAAGQPTVAQWRTCRFRASRLDEARLALFEIDDRVVPLRELGASARSEFLASAERMLETTLEHLRPSVELAAWALSQVGLGAGDVRLAAAAEGSQWRLRLRRAGAFVEQVEALQRREQSYLADRLDAVTAPRARERLLDLPFP